MNYGFNGLMSALLVAGGLTFSASAQPAARQTPQKHAWTDPSLPPDQRADMVLREMTLDEKIQLVHGTGMAGFGGELDPASVHSNGGAGYVPGIPRLGIPDLNMADAAVGVARGAARGRYSTALPSTISLASTWDPGAAYAYGELIGRELRDQGYNVSLGGGANIGREPRNGRGFEYQGEDPILAGRMVAQSIKGLQDQHVIGDIKHYVLNDQETGRYYANVKLDRRSMHESDLLAFEIGVKEGQPGMVMCSYNLIDGDYACENDYTLNQVLKKEWGFKGWVLSDWGGTHSTEKAALAGLDQEQPGSKYFGAALKQAVESGKVPVARLNDMVHRILRTEFAVGIVDHPIVTKVPDVSGGFEVAQHIAEEGMVLLKNRNQRLPLRAETLKSIAVIGSHADAGVLSGGGSAQVDPPGGNAVPSPRREPRPGEDPFAVEIEAIFNTVVWYPSSPLKAIQAKVPAAKVVYDSGTDRSKAAAISRESDVAIVFVHQPSSEGRDLSLKLVDDQDSLVESIAAANPNTIVVLETGGPVAMPWIDRVDGALEAWFPGIRGGEAIANVLFGDANPAGKLPVTFPRSESHLPHPVVPAPPVERGPLDGVFETLPPFDVVYTEGLKVGYKWYESEYKEPLFPFGHGLSYTTFSYSDLKADARNVTVTVTNTGGRTGAEVVQVYASLPAIAKEPWKRLVAWQRVLLDAGQSKTVTLELEPVSLSIYNTGEQAWEVPGGEYEVFVGGSSQLAKLTAKFTMNGNSAEE